MRPSSTGCVLQAPGCVFGEKPNKKWTPGHGMRPWSEASCTGCVGHVSAIFSGELQVSAMFSSEFS
ncbi:hypothetical protein Hanom_Chr07g00594431 [Helianthus anomalus]